VCVVLKRWRTTAISVLVLAGAAGLFYLAWTSVTALWTHNPQASVHSSQVLAAQRGGYQTPELRYCLGMAEVITEAPRASRAAATRQRSQLEKSVTLLNQGYSTARDAADQVDGASVARLTPHINGINSAMSHGVTPPASEFAAVSAAATGQYLQHHCAATLSDGSR